MLYIMEHSKLGFCWWDLLALVILVGVVAFAVIHHKKQADAIRELEDSMLNSQIADEKT